MDSESLPTDPRGNQRPQNVRTTQHGRSHEHPGQADLEYAPHPVDPRINDPARGASGSGALLPPLSTKPDASWHEPSLHDVTDVSPELIAQITERVKREVIEHLKRTGSIEDESKRRASSPPPLARRVYNPSEGSTDSGYHSVGPPTHQKIEAERQPYTAQTRTGKGYSVSTSADSGYNSMPIERERQPYTAQPGAGKVYTASTSTSTDSGYQSIRSAAYQSLPYPSKSSITQSSPPLSRRPRTEITSTPIGSGYQPESSTAYRSASLPTSARLVHSSQSQEDIYTQAHDTLVSDQANSASFGDHVAQKKTHQYVSGSGSGDSSSDVDHQVLEGDSAQTPRRLSVLRETEIQEPPLGAVRESDDQFAAPDLFIRNPANYFSDINRLQQQIYDLGKEAMSHIQFKESYHFLPLPVISDWTPAGAQIRFLVARNLEMAASIATGLKILVKRGFCRSTYSVIVVQRTRRLVLQAVPIDLETLDTLVSLYEEAKIYCGSESEWDLLEQTLHDISEAIHLVLQHLGLDFGAENKGKHSEQRLIQACQTASSTLSVLFLSLVSFVTSHLFANESPSVWDTVVQLHIESVAGLIIMEPRRLKCLNSFVKRPIWTFRIEDRKATSMQLPAERYYLSIFLADFADLWGPIGLQYTGADQTYIGEISVRGGVIRSSDFINPQLSSYPGETMCHWFGWLDNASSCENNNPHPIPATNRLLIGGPEVLEKTKNKRRNLDGSPFRISDVCMCASSSPYSESYPQFELATKKSSWMPVEKTAQVSGGFYATALYGRTWRFHAGWTLKDVILQDWIQDIRADSSHCPKPFYLDYKVILDISRCTGHSQRTTIWSILQQRSKAVQHHLINFINSATLADFAVIAEYFPIGTPFVDIWSSITSEGRKTVMDVVRGLLGILRSTGVVEDGRLQAWDTTSKARLDGRRLDPHWRTMVRDDLACATFAIITEHCMVYAPCPSKVPDGLEVPDRRNKSFTILYTSICITVDEPLCGKPSNTGASDQESELNSVEGDRGRPLWALEGREFEIWKVQKSIQPTSQSSPQRKVQLGLQSARDASRPDPTGIQMIQKRQLSRKAAARNRASLGPEAFLMKRKRNLDHKLTDHSVKGSQENGIYKPPRHVPKDPTRTTEHVFYDVSFHFKNGEGKEIGRLILEPSLEQGTKIDLNAFSESTSVPARWEEHKFGFLASVQAKEEALERRLKTWSETHSRGVLPWAISHAVINDKPAPFVVEHIRGGDLDACQKVLRTYIR